MSGLRFRHVAPAGAPISAGDLLHWLGRLPCARHAVVDLQNTFCRLAGVGHCRVTSTGRAGLTLLLRALRRLAPSERDEVVVPSYTCYSVAASVVKAGLRPRIVDVDPASLDFDAAELDATDFTRVLALVPTNLYGIPNDLPRLTDLAHRRGVYLIDDAAQALGATVGGRLSGTWGDAGLYSLDKGKNVSAIDGGVIVTNSDAIAEVLDQELVDLSSPGARESAAAIVKALVYFVFLRPRLYWIPNAIPGLGLGATVFRTDFALERPVVPLAALARTTMKRLDALTRARRAAGTTLREGLRPVRGVREVVPPEGAMPVYLRLPVLVSDLATRDRLLRVLIEAGIGATGSYPASLVDVAELSGRLAGAARATGGRHVAQRIITLPTHPFVTRTDIGKILTLVQNTLAA